MTPEQVLAMAEIISATSEAVWSIAMIRVYAVACQGLFWGIVCLFAFAPCFLAVFRCIKAYKTERGESVIALAIILAIVGCCSFLVSILCFSGSLGRFLAPEFFAVKLLLGMT